MSRSAPQKLYGRLQSHLLLRRKSQHSTYPAIISDKTSQGKRWFPKTPNTPPTSCGFATTTSNLIPRPGLTTSQSSSTFRRNSNRLAGSSSCILGSRWKMGAPLGARSVALDLGIKDRPRQNAVTPENILRSHVPDVEIPSNVTIHELIFEACDKFKDNIAVEDFLTGYKYTYTELKAASIRVASALYRKGYRRGDVLVAFAVNNADFTVLMLACSAVGIWFSAANPAYSPEELARQINDCGAKGVCASAPLAGVAKAALGNSEFPTNVQDLFVFGEAEGFQPFRELLEDDGKAFPDLDVDTTRDVYVLPYSSGTMGFPKGVMLTHHNIVANVIQLYNVVATTPEDNLLGLLPLHHIFGMVAIQYSCLVGGGSLTFVPKFEPEMFLKCLQGKKINVLHIVPPLLLFMARHPMAANFDLTSVREVVCGAAPLGEDLSREFLTKFSKVDNLRQGYGLTELSPGCNIDMTGTAGSIGQMIPNTLGKIMDTETGEALGAGQLGELCVKGPQVMLGYYKNPQATDEMITSDGWLHTGDIGYYNDDGVVFIKDRIKELIKYKGYQVAPAELEFILHTHPDVQDTAVIGVPDDIAGEVPRAFVVRQPGSETTEDQLVKFIEDKVTATKRLRGGVQFVAEIPKNPSGKILRRVLREKYI